MTNYPEYDRLLTSKIIVTSIMISIVVLLIICCGVYVIIQSRQKILSKKFLIVLAVLLLFSVSGWLITYTNCKMDKEEQAYVTYEGEFSYSNSKFVFLKDSNKTRLITIGCPLLPDGSSRGRLLYSKRSKILLDYELYDN